MVIPPSKVVELAAAWDIATGDPGFAIGPECFFEDINCLELSDRGTFSYLDRPKELGLQVGV